MEMLWNKNFKIAILGTFLSALGGIGLNIALGVVIYDQTQSTILSALFTALSMLPNYILPLFIGSYVDRNNPLKVLVKNEIILASIFMISGIIIYFTGFNYIIYLLITLVISSFGIVSELAGSNIIPQIMPKEFYSQGNAIMSTIYPLCRFLVTPIAMFLFKNYGVSFIFIIYSILTLLDAYIESKIDLDFDYDKRESEGFDIKEYTSDLKDAFNYLKKDKALISVLIGFSFVMFTNGASTLLYPFFNQSAVLNDSNYATLLSIQSLGYVFGGLIHYRFKIPDNKRFTIALIVYVIFSLTEGFFMFYPFVIMVATKFLLGILGMNSANIRVSAVQHRVDNKVRAKINAFFSISFITMDMLGQLIAGALGEFLPLPYIQLGFNLVYFFIIFIIFYPKKNKVRELYNYSTKTA